MSAAAWARRLVRKAILAVSSADRAEQIEGYPVDDGDPDYQHPVRRFQHYGLRSRPGKGTELICVSPEGGTSQRVSIASEAPGQGPTEQEEWEVEIYAKWGQRIRLTKDGDVIVLPADGRKVKLGGDQDAQLDQVALFTALKSYVDGHTHLPGALTAPMGGGAVTGNSGAPANPLPATVAASNTVAKKP